MVRYQQLFENGVTKEQLDDIKSVLSSKQVLTWEEYYWGTKCIIEHDTEESDPSLIIKSIKKAFRNGLNVHSNPDIYQDALKTISAFYGVFGKYEQVINHLMIYIDSLGDSAPDWAYHDLIAAQMHTDQIEIMLQKPDGFLADLSRNDNPNNKVQEKQKNLFRDFLYCATDYLSENKISKIPVTLLEDAAKEYELNTSEAWTTFCEAVSYNRNPPRETQGHGSEPSYIRPPLPSGSGTNIVSIFPDEDMEDTPDSGFNETSVQQQDTVTAEAIDNLKKQLVEYEGIISTLQNAVTVGDSEKEDARKTIDQLTQQLSENQATISRLQKEISDGEAEYISLQQKLTEGSANKEQLTAEISSLNVRIKKAQEEKRNVDAEFIKLQSLYKSEETKRRLSEESQKELQTKLDQIQKNFDDLTRKYEEAVSRLEESIEKSKESESKNVKITIWDIIGKCYCYSNIWCLDAAKNWLKVKLSQIDKKNYMDSCFFPALTPQQVSKANQFGWTKIEDFDLGSILKAVKYNIYKIPSFIPDKDDIDTINDMIDIRNDWIGHYNGNKKNYVDDIYIMSEFLYIMGGEQEKINEMQAFADSLEGTAFA